jgi:hypothetical protein
MPISGLARGVIDCCLDLALERHVEIRAGIDTLTLSGRSLCDIW